jgi:hypothetical protein
MINGRFTVLHLLLKQGSILTAQQRVTKRLPSENKAHFCRCAQELGKGTHFMNFLDTNGFYEEPMMTTSFLSVQT